MLVPVITIPKSGTYLVKEILFELAGLTRQEFSYKFSNTSNEIQNPVDLRRLTADVHTVVNNPGISCYLGHWSYESRLHGLFGLHKPIFVYRHPFEIAVSFVEGALVGLFTDVVADALRRAESREERYLMFLHGFKLDHPWARGLTDILECRLVWATKPGVVPIRYDDLLRIKPQNLDTLLGVPRKTMQQAIVRAVRSKRSQTFRRGQRGSWKQEMPESVKEQYIDMVGPIVRRLGYSVS
jgi:hypothetical protein